LGVRQESSALEHIRRIRRNMPAANTGQRLSYDEKTYLSNIANRPERSPVDDYRRIKQEEAAARAMLM